MFVANVSDTYVAATRQFLVAQSDTALHLLSNLRTYGPRIGDSMNSGGFQCIVEGNQIQAVFCLTRRGNLLLEAAGCVDVAPIVVQATLANPIRVRGVIGEWDSAFAVWELLLASGRLSETYRSREHLYKRSLSSRLTTAADSRVRFLHADDFATWNALNRDYLVELNLPIQGTPDQRFASFVEQAVRRRLWGYFDGPRLIAMASITALYEQLGQIGGVYTIPQLRRRGLGRCVMQQLLADSVRVHGLNKLVLSTGQTEVPAQRLYESLGFFRIGDYALLFGDLSSHSDA